MHLPHRSTSRLPQPPPHISPLHSFVHAFPYCLSQTCFRRQGLLPQWLCEVCRRTPEKAPGPAKLTPWTAKPATALMPFRAGSVAFLSSSSPNKATTMKSPATIPGNPGTPPPMKSARVEVPLPSQEGKKGAMQYALYVFSLWISLEY